MARRTITDSAWVIFTLCLRSVLCADSGQDLCSAVCASIKADLSSSDSCAKARRSLPRPTIGHVCQDAFDEAFRLTCLEACTLHGTGQAPPSHIAEACSKRKRETPKPVVYKACLEGFKGGLDATTSLITERLNAANAQESLWDLNQDSKERGCGANHSTSAPTAVCGVDQTSSSASPIGDVKEETHVEGSDSTIDEPLEHYTDRVEPEQAAASSEDHLVRQVSNKSRASQEKSETGEEHGNIEATDSFVDNSKHAFVDNIASRDVTATQAKYTTATGYHEVEHALRGGIDKETSVMYGNDTTLPPSSLPPLQANSTEERYGNSEGLPEGLEALRPGGNRSQENICSGIPDMPW